MLFLETEVAGERFAVSLFVCASRGLLNKDRLAHQLFLTLLDNKRQHAFLGWRSVNGVQVNQTEKEPTQAALSRERL